MTADGLAAALGEGDGPTIVCAQAGEINTGSFDPIAEIVAACRDHGAWCHIDGAFGLWAAASPARRSLLEGYEGADSWATDGHKWLNVPYDCGIAAVADASAHRAAMTSTSAYIPTHEEDIPWGFDWSPEFSRRARGLPLYAALRMLGAAGLAELIDRCCDHAGRMASLLAEADGVEILNEVVLNQVLVRFDDDDSRTTAVVEGVQRGGEAWLGGTVWHGKGAARVSFSNWSTTGEDVDRLVDALAAALADARAATPVR
jgi:aromatic-L-amino-acid decarboxylase